MPDKSNGNEYLYGIANQQKIEEDENVDVFSPQKVKMSEAKSKKITTSFKCSLCGKSYASKCYEKAKSHKKECPADALLKSKWKPSTKSNMIEKGFMFRYQNVPHVVYVDSD